MASATQLTTNVDRSKELVNGVASTLRRLERDVSGPSKAHVTPAGARRRLETFQRTLARAMQQAHLETVEELTLG